MENFPTRMVQTAEAGTLQLDLQDVDLKTLSSLQGSALGNIIAELREEAEEGTHAKHSSHSSYSSHGTVSW